MNFPPQKWLITESVLSTFNTMFLLQELEKPRFRGLHRKGTREHKLNMLCHWITRKHWPCAQHWQTLSISPDHRHFEVYLQLPPRRQIIEPKLQFWRNPEWTEVSHVPVHTPVFWASQHPTFHYPLWSQPQAHWWRRPVTLTLVQAQSIGSLGQCQFPG